MFARSLKADRAWMADQLNSMSLTEFDRNNALAMVARGVLIGNLLCQAWSKLRRH